jgi:hypothetical protein
LHANPTLIAVPICSTAKSARVLASYLLRCTSLTAVAQQLLQFFHAAVTTL